MIVTSPIVETLASRIPATMSGIASGTRTRHSRWREVKPMPSAASTTSGPAASSPATMFRIRITNVYMTSGISTVTSVIPVTETRAAKTARLGIVYRIPAMAVTGGVDRRRQRTETTARANEIANPIATAMADR